MRIVVEYARQIRLYSHNSFFYEAYKLTLHDAEDNAAFFRHVFFWGIIIVTLLDSARLDLNFRGLSYMRL